MLTEIRCDAFEDEKGDVRKPIAFHKGLNTIIGDGSNSIGKSTFLMIIDFCFGGEDYVNKEKDVMANVGPHSICFEFTFAGKKFHFQRSTDNKNIISICDECYSKTGKISIDAFREWLLKSYQVEDLDLTFRGLISPYFRIYNRGTYNELKPLNSTIKEAEEKGVIALLKMYKSYEEIKAASQVYEEASLRKAEFDNLLKFEVSEMASSKEEYKRCEQEYANLQDEIKRLKTEALNGSASTEDIAWQTLEELRARKQELRKQRNYLIRKLNDENFDSSFDEKEMSRAFKNLQSFFPDTNIKKLEEVEKFHKTISSFLKIEAKENNEKLKDALREIDKEIETIEMQKASLKPNENVSEAVLERYSFVKSRVENIQKAMLNYNRREKAISDYKKAKEELNNIFASAKAKTENSINSKMKEISAMIKTNEKRYPPVLTIEGPTSYDFKSKNDQGTGSRFRNVCILDIALLQTTSLPAIVHDTIMYSNIEDASAIDLLKVIESIGNKQIFIAIDKESRYVDGDGNVATRNCVLRLGDDKKALFGHKWNREE